MVTEFDEQTKESKAHALLLVALKTREYLAGEETMGILDGYEVAARKLGATGHDLKSAKGGIIALGDEWPWPHVTTAYNTHLPAWFETTEKQYDYGLGVLPPIYFPGGFFVSEPATHTAEGVPVYAAFVQRGFRYFVREIPNTRAQIGAALTELDAAVVSA